MELRSRFKLFMLLFEEQNKGKVFSFITIYELNKQYNFIPIAMFEDMEAETSSGRTRSYQSRGCSVVLFEARMTLSFTHEKKNDRRLKMRAL